MSTDEVLSHPDCPLVDIWNEGINVYVKAINEAAVKFLAVRAINTEVGKRKQIVPGLKTDLQYAVQNEVNSLRKRLGRERDQKVIEKAQREKDKELREKFWNGYLGMVKHHGWPDIFLKNT
jgi:hypothetical protein